MPHHELISKPGRRYFCHCMGRGAIGIALSHLSILKDAYDSGYNTIWVMEDDIQVIQNPHRISSLIEALDSLVGRQHWDILFTDQNTKDQNGNYIICRSYAPRPNFSPSIPARFARVQEVGSEFRRIGARYGTYSMIIGRSGIKKLLDYFYRYGIFLPVDMDYCMPDGISLYTVTNDVVSTLPQALSDNR
jgi:GR25 family glycosyltransferase involved in LPS biosynthesis